MEAVLTVAVVFFLLWATYNLVNQQHSNGPKIYPIVGNTMEMLRNKDRFFEWCTEYLLKSPNYTILLKRIGDKPFIVTANPANVEHILKTNFDNYPKGDHISRTLSDLLGDGIFNADDELWKVQRKLASFEFTTRSLRDYLIESLSHEVETRLLPTLSSISNAGNSADLQDVFMRFAFDNICKLSFGIDPACLSPALPSVEFATAFDKATNLITARFFRFHRVVWQTMKLLNIGAERELKEALAAVDKFAYMVIQKRREAIATGRSDTLSQDLLSRFLGTGSFTDKFLRDMVISFIGAGKDTTSVTLAWFFWLLSRHPQVEKTVIEEVQMLSSDRITFTYDELREMHYLHAAISESLRLYPAVPADTKVARDTDLLPDGTVVDKGTRVTYQIYAMGRMDKLWGADCAEFKPERWMKDGKFVSESPYKFPVFQAGPRVCLGREMAMLQMKFVTAALLPRFRFEVVDYVDQVPPYTLNMTFPMRDGLLVKPVPR